MKNNYKFLYILMLAIFMMTGDCYAQQQASIQSAKPVSVKENIVYTPVNSLDLVAYPSKYLNKFVSVKGKFDKFSTLGLDYEPAMRSSEEFITFLIQRDDVKDHNVPLSEMKIFLKRSIAEKHIDLNAGDEVGFSGKIFSNALGDVWMDAYKFEVISKNPDKK